MYKHKEHDGHLEQSVEGLTGDSRCVCLLAMLYDWLHFTTVFVRLIVF